MKKLIFSTGNSFKFVMAKEVCDRYDIKLIQNTLDIDEIQGEDAKKIVIDKVNKAFELLKKPVIVSDDNWVICGLNGFPGPYMSSINKWFTPEDFLSLTRDLKDRRIFLIGYLAYKDKDQLKVFHQKTEGIVLKEVRGKSLYPNHTVFSMLDDEGLSVAEVYDQGLSVADRDAPKIWHDFASWLNAL